MAPAWVLVPRHCLRCQAWHSGSSSARACTAGADRRPTRLVGGEASCSAPLRPLARDGIDGGPQRWDWRRSNRLLAQDGERRARPAGGCAAAGAWPNRGVAHRTAVPACGAASGCGGIGQAQAKHWVKLPKPNGEGGESGGARLQWTRRASRLSRRDRAHAACGNTGTSPTKRRAQRARAMRWRACWLSCPMLRRTAFLARGRPGRCQTLGADASSPSCC